VNDAPVEGEFDDMSRDLQHILQDWPDGAEVPVARKFTAADGQVFVQLRIDLGVLQMAIDGRPDGECPQGYPTYLDLIRERMATHPEAGVAEEHFRELGREMLQFYRRRITLMALARQARLNDDIDEADACYRRAIRDADHNLAVLDLLHEFGARIEFGDEHEQYRAYILMQRATCRAERALLVQDPDAAIEHLKSGITAIQACAEDEYEDGEELSPFIIELRRFERQVRRRYRRRRTLREQLQDAIATENFEQAARLRDALAERAREHDRS
jgi:tetratricopeptide (TPR) repeat protein